ncbi:hypothetical protein J4457_07335 [Candidatus Woesearchaeota archaeon]|nr:hypothetical protein [Candidatus Woesearchaeota archaeon]
MPSVLLNIFIVSFIMFFAGAFYFKLGSYTFHAKNQAWKTAFAANSWVVILNLLIGIFVAFAEFLRFIFSPLSVLISIILGFALIKVYYQESVLKSFGMWIIWFVFSALTGLFYSFLTNSL